MIAKITDANQEYYAPRFAYITAELDKRSDLPSIVIDSLEAYYANIEYIKQLYSREDGSNAGYLLLTSPADEEYFEIDANARTISIPPIFKKYGVGVYGDHLAEMLVFKIDRYFDYQDLYETKVAINWNFTPAGSRAPMYEVTQSDEALFLNDVLEPGCLTFGFVVTKEMTKSKGVLNLSVTFYNEDGGAISYSLNTQTIAIAINDGLTLNDPKEVKSNASDLLNRLRNSAYTPDGLEPIATPKWLTGDMDGDEYLGLYNELNFGWADLENAKEVDYIELQARAFSAGHLGNMNYTWSTNQGDIGERSMGVLAAVDKLKSSPQDANKIVSQANQNGIIVDQNYNEIIVHGNLASLNAYRSTSPSQADADYKWIGIDIGTRVESIEEIKWNGSQLTADDVADSASLGLAANHIIFWAKAEDLLENERDIVLSADGYEDVTLKVRFVDNSGLPSPNDFIEVFNKDNSGTQFVEGHTYYVKNNLGVIDKVHPIKSQEDLNAIEDGTSIYELGSSYKAYGAGSYQVKAQATKLITNNNVNYISVNSELAESNVCVIPSAAVPAVTLEVRSSITEGYTVEDESLDYIYIDSETPPIIEATVVSTEEGKKLGAIALEAVSEDTPNDLTTEQIEANNYSFSVVDDNQAVVDMNQTGITSEGEYKVRAINYKNHTYAVSEPTEVIKTAFIAPAIRDIDVICEVVDVTTGILSPVKVIENGASVALGNNSYTTVSLGESQPVLHFSIVDNSTNNIEGAVVSFTVEEGTYTLRDGFVPMENSDSDPGFEVLTLEEGINTFEIGSSLPAERDKDSFFRIKIENRYKGTVRTTYTGMFYVA